MNIRQEIQLSYILLLAVVFFAATVGAQASWVAYHDILGTDDSGPVTNTSGQNTANATTELVRFSDGTGTSAYLTTSGGTYNGAAATAWTPDAGTDAYSLFNPSGFDLTDGLIGFSAPMSYTFSNLDPSLSYGVALYGGRASTLVSDTTFKLIGANSQTNISSTSTIDDTFTTSFPTRPNNVTGYIARWANIDAGTDGRIRLNIDAQYGYITAVYLEQMGAAENSPVKTMQTQNFAAVAVGTTNHSSSGGTDWGYQTTAGNTNSAVYDLSGTNVYKITGTPGVVVELETIDLSAINNAEFSFDLYAPGTAFEGGDYLKATATIDGPDGTSVIECIDVDWAALDINSSFETFTWSIPDSSTSLSLVIEGITSDPVNELIYIDNFELTGARPPAGTVFSIR